MSNELLEQIERLIQKRPIYKEALSLYRDLMMFLNEIEPEIECGVKDELFHDTKVKEGFPLFSREDLPLDLTAASSLFHRLLEHLCSKKRKDREALEKALNRVQTDPNWIRNVIAAFLSRDETAIANMAEEAGLEPMVLKFLTHMVLRPSLNILKESCSERIPKDSWNYGYCPVCGSCPDMAYLDEQGKRFLHCELCGHEWYYPRLKCPFCENNESKELGYFVSGGEEGFRVDFCKKCNHYVKTLDMRVIALSAPLELENLITLHLDMLAHEQGFTTPHG
ncbi:MAG: formate dehydrogenase accessory protein FdhE [Deltaproteobacteria bacterium]|nr:MAG: formate dehydrogenase accessory protein FdhE [Deltaproteobacteria bacterium]